jgi:hypothetical protein
VALFEKLSNLDIRILYVIMVISATYPLLRPIGLPLPISVQVRNSYDAIENNIKPGDLVFVGVDFEPTQEPELWPQLLAVGRHVARKGARIVLIHMIAGGFRYEERFQKILEDQYNMTYGVNLLSLPFSAGREAAFQSVVADFKGLYQVDLAGRPLTQFPLWNEIKGASDFKMYVQIADAPDWWLRPMSQVPGLMLWNGTVASGASTMAPLYQSGQMVGFIIGMAGAAEYEVLVKLPGPAAAAMDSQSLGHGLIILFVILGNLGYQASKRREAKAKSAR